jgi:hypothetical protein
MQTERTLTLEQELWERVEQVARDEGKTVDALTAEALTRDLARRATQRIRHEAEARREGMTDAQIEGIVNQAVQDWRRERRR